MSRVVCASDYGGPSDPTSGVTGYKGDNLNGKMAFAELRMGTALGNLPYRSKVLVSYNGRSVVAEKLDIGLGGAGCGGHSRDIDLWYQTAAVLGFNGLAPVSITLPGETGAGGQTVDTGLLENIPGVGPDAELAKKALEGAAPGLPENPLTGGGGLLGALGSIPGDIHKIYELLFTPQGWIRVGKVLLGIFLLMSGVLGMANVSAPDPATIVEGGKSAKALAAGIGIAA